VTELFADYLRRIREGKACEKLLVSVCCLLYYLDRFVCVYDSSITEKQRIAGRIARFAGTVGESFDKVRELQSLAPAIANMGIRLRGYDRSIPQTYASSCSCGAPWVSFTEMAGRGYDTKYR
jgi:hypothetical protein